MARAAARVKHEYNHGTILPATEPQGMYRVYKKVQMLQTVYLHTNVVSIRHPL